MPYIRREARVPLDPRIEDLASFINDEGQLNYVITRLAHIFAARKGCNYASFNTTIGVLECCKLEMYRRIMAPYEDDKIKENGDV